MTTIARDLAFYLIFGKPVIMYLGILTLLSFLITAFMGYALYKGIAKFPIKYHYRMAITSLTLACIHGLMGILIYF